MNGGVMLSTAATNLLRYRRSPGLWLLAVVAAAGARFLVARDDGSGIQVAVNRHLPSLDWASLGVSLGVVVATVLLPVAYVYLRSNTTRLQAWQIDEVTSASRVANALGRFAADALILLTILAVLTAAGVVLGLIIVSGAIDPLRYAAALWLIAAPPLVVVAAVRTLLDAVPLGRRALGDVLFFMLWMGSLVAPIATASQPASYATALWDLPGFVRPLTGPEPSAKKTDIAIGTSDIVPGRLPLDVAAGLTSSGYVASRLTWLLLAVAIASLAGLLHRPHTARRRSRLAAMFGQLLDLGPPPPADTTAAPAGRARSVWFGLLLAEFRNFGAGRLFLIAAALVASLGVIQDYRHVGGPAAFLLLVFSASARTGAAEQRALLALTGTTLVPPTARRAASMSAPICWSVLVTLPAGLIGTSPVPLALGAAGGATIALIAMLLASLTRSATPARAVLLVLWYIYLST